MMTQFDCISSKTESQTNNLAREKREREREEKGWGLGGGEDRCLDEGQVFDELSRAINGKEKKKSWMEEKRQ